MRSSTFGLVLLGFLAVGQARADILRYDFESGIGQGLSPVNTGGAFTLSTADGTLRVFKPADDGTIEPNGFISAGVQSDFLVNGDFTATVDFDLRDLPTVGKDQINELSLGMYADTGEFFAVFRFRTDTADHIEVYVPTGPNGVQRWPIMDGSFRISRSGDTTTGFFAPHGDPSFSPIVSLDGFSDPMRVKLLATQGPNKTLFPRPRTALDVGFDNLTIVTIDPGDAERDGDVDIFDVGLMQVYYGRTTGMTWEKGDLDGDGDVDIFDVALLQVNYGRGVGSATTAVPEPSTLVLGVLALIPVVLHSSRISRRRRKEGKANMERLT
ncbi:MAG: dockerin type I domain-containing protein [Pirellulales bacterium]